MCPVFLHLSAALVQLSVHSWSGQKPEPKEIRIFFFLKQSDSYINPKIQFTLL